jgi:hypothetical protein
MATVNYTITKTANPLCWVVSWTGVTNADTCTAFDVTKVPGAGGTDRSIHIRGSFGTDTGHLQGSNDGTNYVVLTDPQGNAISKTAEAIEQVLEYTRNIRPAVSGGANGTLNFYLMVKGSR